MNNMDKIVGRFSSTIFHNEDNFYTVARFLNEESGEELTVVGNIKDLEKGSTYKLYGKYVDHPRFGIQFSFSAFDKELPQDRDALIKYLSSPLFVGIGNRTAEVIVDALGENLIEEIKESPALIEQLPINKRQKQSLQEGILNVDHFDQAIAFFSSHGLSMQTIIRLEEFYGEEVVELVRENPYRLVEEVSGIGFKTADKLAQSLNFDLDSHLRYEAMLLELCLQHMSQTGDSYILKSELKQEFLKKIMQDDITFEDYLFNLLKRRSLIQEDNRIYHATQYDSERYIANTLRSFPQERLKQVSNEDLELYLSQIENEFDIQYDESQLQAIKTFVKEDFSILTGGPGTGKTTIIRGMVHLYKKLFPNLNIALCAPTGRAAKRLEELTGNESYTIHSLLKWDLERNTFGVNESNPLEYDILIIDEFSMVDQWLFAELLKGSINIKKMLIVGDENQLPSVLPGNVLSDLIKSQTFPLIHLEKIYRQEAGSAIVELADMINKESYDLIDFKDDVAFIDAHSEQVSTAIEQVVRHYLDKGLDLEDIQILAPMYKGVNGINTINNRLQELLNSNYLEKKKELKFGYRTFREGDKLLQLKNQTDEDVYNGDIGTLVEIRKGFNNKDSMIVDFDGNFVEYHRDSFHHLTHAYCISIHKSQGSEYPLVIIPIVSEHSFMLQRKLLYTGITRAKRSLILIGNRNLFIESIQKEAYFERRTSLVERLQRRG